MLGDLPAMPVIAISTWHMKLMDALLGGCYLMQEGRRGEWDKQPL